METDTITITPELHAIVERLIAGEVCPARLELTAYIARSVLAARFDALNKNEALDLLEADALRFRKLLATSMDWKFKFDRQNKLKSIKANFSSTCQTSVRYRDQLRKEIDAYTPIPLEQV